MHSPSEQKLPFSSSQALKHLPQCSSSSRVLTQTPPQISSPSPVQSPPVVVWVVPVSVSVSPVVVVVVEVVEVGSESLSDEVEVVVVVVVVVSEVEVVEVEVEVDVTSVVDISVVDIPLVLDIESVPVDDALIDPLVVASVVSPRSSPVQAKSARPTRAVIASGAVPLT